jgi:cytidylate kinase
MSVIAISRGSLRATIQLAEGLSEKLDYKIVSRETIVEAAKKYGIEESGLAEEAIFQRKPPGFWDRLSDKRRQYLTCFKAALLDHALQDSIIYHGHLAHLLLSQVPYVLRVRLDAPMEMRIDLLMREQAISREKAVDWIEDIDHRRTKWAKFLYGVNPLDPTLYDILLNLEHMSLDTAIDIIQVAAGRPEFQATEESKKNLKDLHLAAVLQTHLLKNPRTHGMELDIVADSSTGKVVVTGDLPLVGTGTWQTDIQSVLSELDEVKEIEVKVKQS